MFRINPQKETRLVEQNLIADVVLPQNEGAEMFEGKDFQINYEQYDINEWNSELENAQIELDSDEKNSNKDKINKAANLAQLGGVGLMAIGGVACFIPGGAVIGAGMLKFGQTLAVAGTFGDNALEALELATNDKSFEEEKEEVKELAKETALDAGLFAIGFGAGTAGNIAGSAVLKNTGSKILAKTVDIGLDATISLAGDKALTGEVDLAGEGLSQLLGVLTGSATSKIYGAEINTKLDVFINDKFKLGIGKTGIESPKVETEVARVEDLETEKIGDIDSDANKRTIDDSAWVVQRLDDNTCACASLINAIVNKPELYYELNDRIFLQEDGTYNVVLGGEVLPYHSDSDLPESTAKIVYGAWVEKYGEDYDGDFVTQIFSTLFENSPHEILLKPTTENLAELEFYNNGQHTVLTANKDGHSYTFDGISENGTMLLRDPQNPDSVLEIEPDDFEDWQIVGKSYTKQTLLDGSVENKVGASNKTREKYRKEFYCELAEELDSKFSNEEELEQFLKKNNFYDSIEENKDSFYDFFVYYGQKKNLFEEFCMEKGYSVENGGKEVASLTYFMEEFGANPSIVQEFVGRVREQYKQPVKTKAKTTEFRLLPTNNKSLATKLLGTISKHITSANISEETGGIYGCHIDTQYKQVEANGKLTENLSIEIKGQTFILVPTNNGSFEYSVYDVSKAIKNKSISEVCANIQMYSNAKNGGVTGVGKKTLCTQLEWKNIETVLKTKGGIETDADGCFYFNDKIWQLHINSKNGSCYPLTRKAAGGKKDLPELEWVIDKNS